MSGFYSKQFRHAQYFFPGPNINDSFLRKSLNNSLQLIVRYKVFMVILYRSSDTITGEYMLKLHIVYIAYQLSFRIT